jgi:hypothetical protein
MTMRRERRNDPRIVGRLERMQPNIPPKHPRFTPGAWSASGPHDNGPVPDI